MYDNEVLQAIERGVKDAFLKAFQVSYDEDRSRIHDLIRDGVYEAMRDEIKERQERKSENQIPSCMRG